MRRRALPPPQRLSPLDVAHFLLALLMIPLGATLLVRTLLVAPNALGILAGLAFLGFGVYRLWLAITRYIAYRRGQGEKAK